VKFGLEWERLGGREEKEDYSGLSSHQLFLESVCSILKHKLLVEKNKQKLVMSKTLMTLEKLGLEWKGEI
jgi:hypothetical protein